MGQSSDSGRDQGQERSWEPMKLTFVGEVGEVLQGGGGKLTIPAADSGDAPRKPPGQE